MTSSILGSTIGTEVIVLKLNEKLKVLLTNQGWSQKRLAEMIYVSPDAVSSWVRGINQPDLDTIKKLCEIFYIPIQDMTNDDFDVPEYFEIDRYLPYPICCYSEENQDSIHIIIDANLAHEGKLHRFTNPGGAECSAIYRGNVEVWWHYREREAKMISDWNKRYEYDR